MALDLRGRDEKVALGGAILAAVGSFLPWVEASALGFSTSVSGVEGGDGWITLVAALVVAGVVLFADDSRLRRGALVVCSLVIAGIGLLYISDPTFGVEFDSRTQAQIGEAVAEPALGLYVTALGGVVVFVSALIGDGRDTRTPATESPRGRQTTGQPRRPSTERGRGPAGEGTAGEGRRPGSRGGDPTAQTGQHGPGNRPRQPDRQGPESQPRHPGQQGPESQPRQPGHHPERGPDRREGRQHDGRERRPDGRADHQSRGEESARRSPVPDDESESVDPFAESREGKERSDE